MPGVPRSETPVFMFVADAALTQLVASLPGRRGETRTIDALPAWVDVPAKGTRPFPTRSMTMPEASRRERDRVSLLTDNVLVTTLACAARLLRVSVL